MDRAFMEHYFDTVYEDFIGTIASDNEDYHTAQQLFATLQNEMLVQCGNMDHPIWQKHESVLSAYYHIELVLMKLAYLKGAEDRERMLR